MALTRGIHADTLAAMRQPVFFAGAMVRIDWPSGEVRVHSGVGPMTWAGQVWQGVGAAGSIAVPEEATGLAAQSAMLRLVGVPDDLDDYLDEPVRGRDCWIAAVVTTERAGAVIVGAPIELFAGYVDALRDVTDAGDGTLRRGVMLAAAPGPSQRSAGEIYHTDEDQRRAFPADTAGQLTQNAEARARTLRWPE